MYIHSVFLKKSIANSYFSWKKATKYYQADIKTGISVPFLKKTLHYNIEKQEINIFWLIIKAFEVSSGRPTN